MSTNSPSPAVDTPQIMAAGLAATGAAFVTSRFGVAGTLLGAALTAMIITGGSSILRAYVANASSRVRGGVTRFRERGTGNPNPAPERAPTQEAPRESTLPERPDLRDNLVGRLRAAMDWFRNLPTPSRRPILIKALIAAGVAFVICMFAIWGVEKLIGNSLSCGLWQRCPYGAAPGIHPAGFDDSGARSSLAGGGVDLGGGGGVIDSIRQSPAVPDGPDILPGGADSSADSSASPAPDSGESASPAPEAPLEEEAPSSASPAAKEQASPDASASAGP